MPYLGKQPTASDTLSIFKFVATSSQTTFTGADADGSTLSYDIGNGSCQVWLNGIRLDRSDVTATDGTSVVLAACTAGDIVHIQATKAFIPADVVPKAAGGTFDGAVVAGAGATVPSGQTLTIASGATIANSGTATGFGGDLSFGGDTFGANKVIGSNDTYSLSLETDGNTAMTISTAGEITKPLQPCVYVHKSSNQTNIAVDSDVTVTWQTEVFDIGANFSSNTFTAPVTGKYLLNYSLRLDNLDSASTYYYIGLVFSNRAVYPLFSPTQFAGDVSYWNPAGSIVADMDASDTVYVVVRQASGTSQTDIDGGGGSGTYLSIALIS